MTKKEGRSPGRFKRKLTPFLCQEMLFDYAVDRLDSERKSAVTEFLQTDKECQTLLENIRKGLEYTESLKKTHLHESVVEQLSQAESVLSLSRKYSSWRRWPETLRWSLTAIIISTVLAMFIGVVPWAKLKALFPKKSDTVEIAQIGKLPDRPTDESQDHPPGDATSEEGSGDEEIEAANNHGDTSIKQNIAREQSHDDGDEGDEVEAPRVAARAPVAPPPSPPVAVAEKAAQPSQAKPNSALPDQSGEEKAESKSESKAKGFVYRAFMTLGSLDDIGPKIVENIKELGGEKAGEVELGWKRGTGRYFHFALPEDNEERLLEKLRAYGPVRISKDPHPRVMPTGQIRVILWVESAK